MHKWHVVYQTIYEARVVIEAKNEEELADLMEEGDFELEWHPLNTFSEIDSVEWDDEVENDDDVPPGDFGIESDPLGALLSELGEY